MKHFLILFFLTPFLFSLNFEKPLSFKENLSLNVKEILIDQKFEIPKEEKGFPLQVGIPMSYMLDLHKLGNYDFLKDGKVVWRISFYAPSYLWLSFEFDTFKVPSNSKIFVYKDENLIFPLERADDGVFIIPPFPSNRCFIEIDFYGEKEPFDLKLSTVVLGFKDFLKSEKSQYCEVDINCPEGADWQKEKRSVTGIYFSGYFCTGSLINNARFDCKNYVLTAHHCINDEATANRAVFYWNYEWSECGGGELLYGDNTPGANLRATNQRSDFSLLEIKSQPKEEFRVYYSGWSRDPNPPTGAVIIHHPDADPKKISIEQHKLNLDGTFWKVPHYEVGATEPGSSGSPIYNMSHKIIGQLYGGYSTCDRPRNDYYGAFHISFSAGIDSSSRLKEWLDPDNTGVMEVEGMDSVSCYRRHMRPFN